jgi:tRNA dimethylallyltransferase
MQAIGYREIARWLCEGGDPAALAEPIARRTRQYAKRQLTWFRRHPEVHWTEPGRSGEAAQAARNFLLRTRERR